MQNDSWLRFPNNNDVWFFGTDNSAGPVGNESSIISNLQGPQSEIVFPKGSSRITAGTTPAGNGSNGYFKIYLAGGASQAYQWEAFTSDNDAHNVYVWFVNAGTHRMEISERSAGHAIDRFVLYKVDGPNYTASQLSALPASTRGGGGPGAADNSPYNVMVTVTDDAIPANSTTVQFSWAIGPFGNQPPNAVASAAPMTGNAPLAVNFTGGNSTDDVAIAAYSWNFGDGTPNSSSANPSHTYTGFGTFNAVLTVTDGGGLTDTDVVSITVSAVNEAPVAVATAAPLTGEAPLEVEFTGSNSSDDLGITGFLWDFKDGSPTSALADPVHTFSSPGTYEVELTVTDGGGLTDTDLVSITVSAVNEAPVAVAAATPLTGDAPLEVEFTGSSSTDDFGIIGYLWDFNDGGPTSSEADPVHTFASPGTYVVELTVSDGGGLTDTDMVTITVSGVNEPPVAVAEATPLTGDAPLEVEFTGSSSTDDFGIIGYLWDFKDGGPTSAEADPVHTFTSPGTYVVELTVSDGGGLTDTDMVTITVSGVNEPPVAVAEATPLTGDAPLEVEFTGSSSTDDFGIIGYLWDFKDGGPTSAEADPVHTFTSPGTYVVELTVSDGGGLTDTDMVTITVSGVNQPPVAIIGADPIDGIAPLEVTFIGSNSTDDFNNITGYSWDFGDGTTSTEADPVHTFTSSGQYNVALTVEDAGGLTGTANVTISVDNVASGELMAVLIENPSKDGIAKIQVLNKPDTVEIVYISLYAINGKEMLKSRVETGSYFEIPVATLSDGLYIVNIGLNQGKPLLLKLLVDN